MLEVFESSPKRKRRTSKLGTTNMTDSMFHFPQITCKLPASETGYLLPPPKDPPVLSADVTELEKRVECGSGYSGTAKLTLCDSQGGDVTLSGCELVF
jgi:hypothetical protein